MQLNHSFVVPLDVEETWKLLRDVERIAPCMPGAAIDEVHGEELSGRVKVKLGPMQVTYTGRAMFTELDHDQHRTVIEARGKEARGTGTADATVTAELYDHDGHTEVSILTDLAITGRAAQLGRGVLLDVGEKLLDQFAACLSEDLAGVAPPARNGDEPTAPVARDRAPEPPAVAPAFALMQTEEARPGEDSLDLLGVAGGPVLRRVVPVAGVLGALWMLVRLLRRRRA